MIKISKSEHEILETIKQSRFGVLKDIELLEEEAVISIASSLVVEKFITLLREYSFVDAIRYHDGNPKTIEVRESKAHFTNIIYVRVDV